MTTQTVNTVLHITVLFAFLVATGFGVKALWNRTPYFASTLFGTLMAVLNVGFRGWLVLFLISDMRAPQPFTIQAALVLQVGLAMALTVWLGTRYTVDKTDRELNGG